VTSSPVISVCVVCRNEADKLGPCLESVTWADEIVVLDLESSDRSAEVAHEHGARVIRHHAVPIVEAVRNVVADAATGEWVLALDPDERVTPGLRDELLRVRHRTDVDAVSIPYLNYDLGYPESRPPVGYSARPRFYRRSSVRWPEIPNALPEIAANRLLALSARDELVIVHDRNRTVAEAIERALRYAPAEAQAMVDRGDVFTARAMLGALAGKIHKHFVVARPWRDGVPGFLRAGILVAFYFYVWAAFWQLSGRGRAPEDDRFTRRASLPLRLVRVLGYALRPIRLVRALAGGVRR
jgi:glycosyltransferase involved in cell wall biosynthesis